MLPRVSLSPTTISCSAFAAAAAARGGRQQAPRLLLARIARPATAPAHARLLHHNAHEHPEFHSRSTRYGVTTREKLERLENIGMPHYEPVTIGDKLALRFVKFLRRASDKYFEDRLIQRACMLETVAAVPGMAASMIHHNRALRHLRHCAWIKATSDEAENERMHLMTFLELMSPTYAQRLLIVSSQYAFFTAFFTAYMIMPRICHRFVGYLEEEACSTYTKMLNYIDEGKIENVAAPNIAKQYWGLPEDATLRDVVLVVRADEADHRLVNHVMGDAFKDKTLAKPCDVFTVDLERPFQSKDEQTYAAGRPVLPKI